MIVILCITVLITELLRYYGNFAQQSLVLIYVLSVLIISCMSTGYLYGFFAAVVSTLACDFLIVTPRLGFSFTIGSPFTLITLLLVTVITSTLTTRLQVQSKLARAQEQYFHILYDINRKLLSARSIEAIIHLINTAIIDHVGRPAVFYKGDPLVQKDDFRRPQPDEQNGESYFVTPEQYERIHRIFLQDDVETYPDAVAQEAVQYVPVYSNDSVIGVIAIGCEGKPMSPDELSYVYTLAGQVALAFELQHMSDKQEQLAVDTEKEKMRGTLLRAISHDLRTPMTTIHGASVAMLEHEEMPTETRIQLLGDIAEYSKWLIRMVENILIITKMSGDEMRVTKKTEAAEEVIAQAVSIVRKRYTDCNIRIQIPDDLLLVPMDATLISQVLINLLENAVKNSPAGSLICATLQKGDLCAEFLVIDRGNGISDELADCLFKTYAPYKGQIVDAAKGIGIGLSICKTIIDAHGGEIKGYNKKEGGAIFAFTLPLEEDFCAT